MSKNEIFGHRKKLKLLSLLLDDLTTSVVAALWAYSVIHDSCTAV